MNKWQLFIAFLHNTWGFYYNAEKVRSLSIDEYLRKHLYNNPKYSANSLCLNKYEFKVFSQNGEDGIIEEIFNRIGTTNNFFAEIGVGTGIKGLENNTTYLLTKGWEGLWIDTEKVFKKIQSTKLLIKQLFITVENAERELNKIINLPKDLDLLSIDIDGNDYHIWKAIKSYSPRVVVIEYNALFPPIVEWIMKYNPKHRCIKPTQYFGASLKSYELLGREKGYSLVGCNFMGMNAFFVRNDLVKNKFFEPLTAENHYEPIRYFLYHKLDEWRTLNE